MPPSDNLHVIDPRAVYWVADLERYFHLKRSSVRRESSLGRLRIGKRGGRSYCLGSWLIEWLEAGELKRRPIVRDTEASANIRNGQ